MKKNRDRLLGYASFILLLSGFFYLFEFYVLKRNLFKKFQGVVVESEYDTYEGYKRKLFGKSVLRIEGIKRDFIYVDKVDLGAYIDVNKGDTISVHGFSRLLGLLNFFYVPNIVKVEKNGAEVFDSYQRWKQNLKMWMWIFTGAGIFLMIIYLDIVKGISLENWFQKKILKNPAYVNRKIK